MANKTCQNRGSCRTRRPAVRIPRCFESNLLWKAWNTTLTKSEYRWHFIEKLLTIVWNKVVFYLFIYSAFLQRITNRTSVQGVWCMLVHQVKLSYENSFHFWPYGRNISWQYRKLIVWPSHVPLTFFSPKYLCWGCCHNICDKHEIASHILEDIPPLNWINSNMIKHVAPSTSPCDILNKY